MSGLVIRPMRPGDIQDMENICLSTADEKLKKTFMRRENTLFLYNRYYTRAGSENCFVAADENDRAVGYIICAENCREYIKSFYANELKRISGVGSRASAALESASQMIFYRHYPAHLHIDILPEYQGGGTGTKLMSTLLSHLREKRVRGVMLGVASCNERAIGFYEKQGFKKLMRIPGCIIFGIKLEEGVKK